MSMHILRQVREALSNLNPESVRETAERRVTIGLSAASSAGLTAIEDFLAPPGISRGKRREIVEVVYRTGDPGAPDHFDLEICEAGFPCSNGTFLFDPANPSRLVEQVLERQEALGLPLARLFAPFRKAVVERITFSVARENGLFSIFTALPDIAPGILQIPWAAGEFASDTAFLTVNQIRMAFLLAAASDRPVGYREQKAEVASIIAGAFGWRTLARELAGKIPFGVGLIPKAAIAFAGTYVVGLSLERYYRLGYGLSRSERRTAYTEALERGRQVAGELISGLKRRNDPGPPGVR